MWNGKCILNHPFLCLTSKLQTHWQKSENDRTYITYTILPVIYYKRYFDKKSVFSEKCMSISYTRFERIFPFEYLKCWKKIMIGSLVAFIILGRRNKVRTGEERVHKLISDNRFSEGPSGIGPAFILTSSWSNSKMNIFTPTNIFRKTSSSCLKNIWF